MGRLRKSLLELASRVRGRPGDWARRFDAWDTSIRGRTAATWGILRTRQGMTVSALALALIAFVAIDYATLPPPLPGYAQVRAAWRPSEAWLYDRDGVLIRCRVIDGKPYPVSSVAEMEILPGVREALFALREAGYCLIVVTNQPVVARGIITEKEVDQAVKILGRILSKLK